MLLGIATTDLCSLPAVVVLALLMAGTRRSAGGSIVVASTAAAIVVCGSLIFLGTFLFPETQGTLRSYVVLGGLGAVLGVLYWWIVVRAELRQTDLQESS